MAVKRSLQGVKMNHEEENVMPGLRDQQVFVFPVWANKKGGAQSFEHRIFYILLFSQQKI